MWVWVNSGSWWWTRRPGVLRFMGLQRVGHDWATELNWCWSWSFDTLATWCKEPIHQKEETFRDAGKDWRQKEHGGSRGLDGLIASPTQSEQTLGDTGGQRSLACYSPQGHRVGDDLMTKQQQINDSSFGQIQFSSVQFSRSVMSDSLWPHESQHARPPCPSPTPGVHSNSRPSSQWWYPAISSLGRLAGKKNQRFSQRNNHHRLDT